MSSSPAALELSPRDQANARHALRLTRRALTVFARSGGRGYPSVTVTIAGTLEHRRVAVLPGLIGDVLKRGPEPGTIVVRVDAKLLEARLEALLERARRAQE